MPHATSSPIQAYLHGLLADLAPDASGAVADYIPALAAADPDRFGIALCTADGAVYTAGDHAARFTIQSMSKPFTYALALEDLGLGGVDERIGVEPTGDAFNSISLEPGTGRPRNPMVNAGAIAATSLVQGDREARILELYSRCAGRPLAVDEATSTGERETGDRNRALAYLLRAAGIVEEEPGPVVDAYFRQCSIEIDCVDGARMAATLAAGGIEPGGSTRILGAEHVQRVLSVMAMCGMYDAAGDWMVDVGLPAKSGVAGGVIAVLPGQLGLCVFSPRLDAVGNSVRGVAACERLSRELSLHAFDVARASHASVRARFDLTLMPSTRRWPAAERAQLSEVGQRCAIYELQGDLVFGAIERVIRDAVDASDELDIVILDLARSDALDAAARRRFAALAAGFAADGKALVLASTSALESVPDARTFQRLDDALEWAEWTLLGRDPQLAPSPLEPAEHPLLAGMTASQRTATLAVAELESFAAGAVLGRAGESAPALTLLLAGEVQMRAEGHRVATLMPGATFGGIALSAEPRRAADLIAARDGAALHLPAAALDTLATTDPASHAALLRGLLAAAQEQLVRLARQVAAHE